LGVNDIVRVATAVQGADGKRLTYHQVDGSLAARGSRRTRKDAAIVDFGLLTQGRTIKWINLLCANRH
jgi:hypothetical protein